MYLEFFNSLFGAVAGIVDKWFDIVAGLIVALAFVIGLVQSICTLWTRDIEHFKSMLRYRSSIFMLVLALTVQLPGLDVSVLKGLPRLIIASGFSTANTVLKAAPGSFSGSSLDDVAGKIEERVKQDRGNFKEKWIAAYSAAALSVEENKPFRLSIGKYMDYSVARTGFFAAYVLLFLPGMIVAPGMTAEIINTAWLLSSATSLANMNMAMDWAAVAKCSTLTFDHIAMTATDFLFHTIAFFSFSILILITVIRAVVFCAIFPVSAITVPFDSRRQVFVNNIWKMFTLALTPALLACVLVVCVEAYALLSTSGGILDQIRGSYLGSGPTFSRSELFDSTGMPLAAAGLEVIKAILIFICKCVIYLVAGPVLLSFIALKILWSAPKTLEDLLGVGIGAIDSAIPGGRQAAAVASKGML